MSTHLSPALDAAWPRTFPGAPTPVPSTGNLLLSNAGPASYADRSDVPDLTVEGHPKIQPMSVLSGWSVSGRDPDPRGMRVVAGDGVVAGTVTDLWVDRSEPQIRYYEVEVAANGRRVLVPFAVARVRGRQRELRVKAIHAAHFAEVPGTRLPDRVTLLEEDRIMAYFAGGYLWADPSRQEPVL